MSFLKSTKKQLRHHIGPPLQALGYATGFMQLTARFRRINGAIILMYHSVADDAHSKWVDPRNHVPAVVFRKQMEFLARERRVVALTDLIAMLHRGRTPETGTVVITFDDGYLDNFTIAASILDYYGLTATLFLPTVYIDREEAQWVDQAYTAFKFRTKHVLTWGQSMKTLFDLDDAKQYVDGYQAVCQALLSASAIQRRILLDDLHKQLQPASHPPRLTMNWDEVRTLLGNHHCFEIGGHTLEHADLTSISHSEAKNELIACSQRIKDELGVQPCHFSFCYGRTSEPLRQLVSQAGFEAAFGACGNDPVVTHATDLFDLPRLEAPASMRCFDLLTSPANTGIWRKLGRGTATCCPPQRQERSQWVG